MSCKVVRNENGTVNTVLTENNQESKLFEAINNNLFLGGVAETSLNTYKAVLTTTDAMMKEGEPALYYQGEDGVVFEDLEQALIDNKSRSFKIGTLKQTDGTFQPIGKFNTESTPVTSYLAESVRTGLISTERNYDKSTGESYVQGKGVYNSSKKISANLFQDQIALEAGIATNVTDKGIQIVETTTPYLVVTKKNGEVEVVNKYEAPKLLQDSSVTNKADIVLQTYNFFDKTLDSKPTISSSNLNISMNNLESLLQSLGFTTTTLEEYKKAYKVRHGNDIDVAGLVDMNNRVIAIAEGQDVRSVITEEVAHIAVEAYHDQASIADALIEVVETQEYRDFANQYREKYSDEYQGVALEEKVRKEILGKVLAKELSTNNVELSPARQTIWESFVNYIRSRFTPRKKTALDAIVKNIKDAIAKNDISQFSKDFINSGGVYFSLTSNKKITDDIKNAYNMLLDFSKQTKKAGENIVISVRGNATILEDSLNDLSALNKINDITSSLKANLQAMAVKQANNEMTATDITIFKALYDRAFPAMEGFSSWATNTKFKDKKLEKLAGIIEADLQETMKKISDLRTEVLSSSEDLFDKIVEESTQDLTEPEKIAVVNSFTGVLKDLSSVLRMWTPSSASSSPFIRLAGSVITKMATTVDNVFNTFARKQADNYNNLGWKNAEKAVIATDKNGNKTEYFIDAVDHQGADKAIEDANIKYIVSQVKDVTEKQVRDKLKNRETKEDILIQLLRKENPNITEREIDVKLKEQTRVNKFAQIENKTQYYKKEKFLNDEKLVSVANVSEESFAEDEAFRRQINDIRSRYFRKGGKFNIADMSEGDRLLMQNVERSRAIRRSPLTTSGDYALGLNEVFWEDMTPKQKAVLQDISKKLTGKDFNPDNFKTRFVVLEDGFNLEDLDSDARYAIDMSNLSIARRLDNESKGISPSREASTEFINNINNIVGEDRQLEYLEENSTINFTDEYYEFIEENGINYGEVAQNYINTEKDVNRRFEKQEALDRYKELLKIKSRINRTYRSKKDSTEVEANDMSGSIRAHIIEIDEQISDIKRIIRVPEELTTPEVEPISERRIASSFEKMREESGKTEYDFALNHMSDSARRRVENFKAHVGNVVNPNRRTVRDKFVEENFARIMTENSAQLRGKTQEETINAVVAIYAKENLASYFYGTSLRNLQEIRETIKEDVRNGRIKTADILNPSVMQNYTPFITFQPNFVWSEQDTPTEYIDPEYNQLKGSQPRMSLYKNNEYFSRYGVTEEEWNSAEDSSTMTARNNVNEFEFLKLMLNNNKEVNRIYNTNTDVMLRPQISQTVYEKLNPINVKNTFNSAKEALKDTLTDRVDDPQYGDATYNAIGLKMIPKLYRQRLEDPGFLTENSFGASMQMMREAISYKKRTEVKHILDAIHDQVMNTEFTKGNPTKQNNIRVKGELSQTAKGLQELSDYYLYGIKQDVKLEAQIFGQNVDFTKILTKFQKYSSFVNLAYSPLIATTSLTTGTYNNLENSIIEEYYSKNASRRGTETLAKDMTAYYSATGAIHNKSKLSGISELFGLKSSGSRFENSSTNRAGRILSETAYMMDEFANVPVLFKPLYAILYDTRYFESADGTKKGYIDYNSFKAYMRTTKPNISKSEIKTQWGLIENETLMQGISYNKETGEVSFNDVVKGRLTELEQQKLIEKVGVKAKNLGQQVDGVLSNEDRIMAQRNAITNTLMQHKGFLFINLARSFKAKNYNFHTGQIEEGHWRTASRLVGELVKDYKNAKDILKNLDSLSKKNLARVGIRIAVTALLLALSKFARASDDGEDDSFAEDFARIITYRTYNETKDMSPFGLAQTMWETVKNPVVLSTTLEEWYKLYDKITPGEGEEVDGSAVGKITRKLVGAKTYDQMRDLNTYTNSWLYYNREKLAPIYNYTEDEQ